MSEWLEQTPGNQFSSDFQAAAAVTAGTLLRQAREAAGLHIAALAVSLKVPVNKLEALESDRIDQLPDAVFARALAASVCRTLKIDPGQVLEKLPQTRMPHLAGDDDSINAPFRAPGAGPRLSLAEWVSRPVLLAVLALLLGAVVLIFLPTVKDDASPTGAAIPTATETDPQRGAAAPGAGTEALPVPAAGPIIEAAPPTLVAPAEGNAGAAVAVSGQPEPAGLVVFRARAVSWVQVTDATGAVTLRKTLSAGETAGASGTLPLSVVVGSADAMQVEVRGKPMNLTAMAKSNVARFEVK